MPSPRKLISDPELQAMGEVVAALESLSAGQRERFMQYLWGRYVLEPLKSRYPEDDPIVRAAGVATMPLFPEAEPRGCQRGYDPQFSPDAEEGE